MSDLPSSDDRWHDPAWRELADGPRRQIFEPGQRVAGRYEIVRLIARGSVGEVYEARDRELRLPVALKTIAPKVAANPRIRGRFRREIRLARQIAHRNVCRIHDLGVHRDATGEEVLFLTMELLHGESLADRLARLGPLAPADALPIARQIAAGLEAAHAVGVVHRDLKSANVMLEDDAGELRVVITDFGLARDAVADPRTESVVTREGAVVGTPAYMSPEQVAGERAGPAADVYAFGVVLFELVTGRLPFVGERPLDVAARRLREPPPRPRSILPALDTRWDAVIVRCLALDPGDRFVSPADVIVALERRRMPATPRQRRRFLTAGAAVLAAVTVLAGVVWWGTAAPRTAVVDPVAAAATARQRVLVLGLRQLGPERDDAWIGHVLTTAIATTLGGEPGLVVITGEEVARARRELDPSPSGVLADDTVERLARRFDADVICFGSFVTQPLAGGGERAVRVDLRLQRRGQLVPLVVEGRSDDVLGLVGRAGEEVRAALIRP